jgi:FkbM family methyltransferase
MTEPIVYPPRWMRTLARYQRLVAGFRNWPRFLAFKWDWIPGPISLETRGGLKFQVPLEARFEFKDVFLHQAYGFRKVLDQLPAEPVVLDIGANVGFFSLFALHCRPAARCLSFEPLAANYLWLKAQRGLNPSRRWEIFQQAVMGSDGEVQICSQKEGQADASAVVVSVAALGQLPPTRRETVPARSLQTIFAQQRLERCHWLKLDCEGCEYEVLYQCPADLLRQVDMISLEVHELDRKTRNGAALCAHLAARGFRMFQADDAVVHALRS